MARADDLLYYAQIIKISEAENWVSEWVKKARGEPQDKLIKLLGILIDCEMSIRHLMDENAVLRDKLNEDEKRILQAYHSERSARAENERLHKSIDSLL